MKASPDTPGLPPDDPALREFAAFLARTLDPGECQLPDQVREELRAAFRRHLHAGGSVPADWETTALALGELPPPAAPLDPTRQQELDAIHRFAHLLEEHLDPGEFALSPWQRQLLRESSRLRLKPHEITAWALGEMDPARFLEVEQVLARSPALRAEARGLRAFCDLLWRLARPVPRPNPAEIRRLHRLFSPSPKRRVRLALAATAGLAAAITLLLSISRFDFDPLEDPAIAASDQPADTPPPAAAPLAASVLPAPRPSPRSPSLPPNPATPPDSLAFRSLPPPPPFPAHPTAWPPETDALRPSSPTAAVSPSPADSPAITTFPVAREPGGPITPSGRPILPSLDPNQELPPPPDLSFASPTRSTRTSVPQLPSPADQPTVSTASNPQAAPPTASSSLPPAPLPDPGVNFTTSNSYRIGDLVLPDPDDPVDPPDIVGTDGSTDSNPPAELPLAATPNLATITLGGLQPYLLLGLHRSSILPPVLPDPAKQRVAWAATAGFQLLEYDSLIGNAGFDADTWAGKAAAALAPDLHLGASASHLDSRVEVDAFGHLDLTGDTFAAWLDWHPDPWRFILQPSWSSFDQDLFRHDAGLWHSANQGATLFGLSLAASRLTPLDRWSHGPIFTIDAAWGSLDGYLESGPAPVAVAPRSFRSLSALAGWHLTGSFGPWSPHATLGWRHDFESPDPAILHSSPGGFVAAAPASPSPDSLLLEAGIRLDLSQHSSLLATWLTEWRTSDSPDHSFSLLYRLSF